MASESYIERLQREKKQLVAAVKAMNEWHAAMIWAQTTGRKGTAFQEADKRKEEMNAALHIIEPILAEGDTK